MADAKISALSAGTAFAGTEEIPGVQSATTVKFTPAQIRTYVAANMTPITLTGGTVTSSTPVIDAAQTWNSGGVTFTGMKVNVTDTASASASLLADFQVGGSAKFSVRKDGALAVGNQGIYLTGTAFSGARIYTNGGNNIFLSSSSGVTAEVTSSGLNVGNNQLTLGSAIGVSADTGFVRAAAGVVKVTNASSGSGALLLAAVAVASLPSASTAGSGARHTVNDSSVTTFGSTVAAGGSSVVPVYSDGTNWKVG